MKGKTVLLGLSLAVGGCTATPSGPAISQNCTAQGMRPGTTAFLVCAHMQQMEWEDRLAADPNSYSAASPTEQGRILRDQQAREADRKAEQDRWYADQMEKAIHRWPDFR